MISSTKRRACRTIAALGTTAAVAAAVVGCSSNSPVAVQNPLVVPPGADFSVATVSDPARLDPPPVPVTVNAPGGADGDIFLTPSSLDPAQLRQPHGAEILDKAGRPIWYHPLPYGALATNLQVQTYRGKPVLTWWQGTIDNRFNNFDDGVDYIADEHYHVIAAISDLGHGLRPEVQEFRITPDGTALITSRKAVPTDLTPIGGPKNGAVFDYYVSRVDLATGKVDFQWDALAHIPLTDTYLTATAENTVDHPLDWLTINSVAPAPDGHLLLSGRYTKTVYDIDPKSGDIAWRLGGKHSSFTIGPGADFAFQHDAQFVDDDTIRMMNNNNAADGVPGDDAVRSVGPSGIEWIRIDRRVHTATLIRTQPAPDGVVNTATGNAQGLPNGNVFGSWGFGRRIAEFTPTGDLVYDATVGSYRAFLQQWHGVPDTRPQVSIDGATAHAIWNGATGVAHWRLLSGTNPLDLEPITDVAWNGLNTAIAFPMPPAPGEFAQVQALDAGGKVIGTSMPVLV
ncbi:arylsulfotransferase family protein [Nocardia sp. NEAU-G5]|uniref:Arylsulfotransferase family protein n=1 Tax=Nocardia albiluteola TaxID=2842303 RepID=A0ABS6BDK4_9NOCA|nr:arylsulfotransferase family protein [Nocardia albiluteola]MBU3067318.1 arylsulfotransferase family protein [Nocardia albiluteola]